VIVDVVNALDDVATTRATITTHINNNNNNNNLYSEMWS